MGSANEQLNFEQLLVVYMTWIHRNVAPKWFGVPMGSTGPDPSDALPGSFGILRSSWLVQGWRCRDLPQASRVGAEERKGGDVRNHWLRGCYCHIFWFALAVLHLLLPLLHSLLSCLLFTENLLLLLFVEHAFVVVVAISIVSNYSIFVLCFFPPMFVVTVLSVIFFVVFADASVSDPIAISSKSAALPGQTLRRQAFVPQLLVAF